MSLPAIRSPRVPAPPHRFDPSPDLAEENTMTIPPDLEAQILRYYHVEKWRVGTIARQLHVHHGTVARVLAQAGLPRIGPPARRSQVEPYLPFIHQTLEKFPTLTASRLYAMVRERGYRGSGDHSRHLIACYRTAPGGGGLSTSAQPARRAGASRLGAFWSSRDRPRTPSLDGLRHGAELLAPDFPALLPRCPHGELPARSRRRLHGLERMCACPALRQSQERGAGAPRRRHPLSSHPPSAATISEPSPPPCCGCWSVTAPPSLTPPFARRSRAACLIPMRCGSHSI